MTLEEENSNTIVGKSPPQHIADHCLCFTMKHYLMKNGLAKEKNTLRQLGENGFLRYKQGLARLTLLSSELLRALLYRVDDVKIFNYALTAAQVKTLYNNGAVYFGPTSGTP